MAETPAKARRPAATKSALIERTKEASLARHRARLGELLALVRRRVTEVVEGFYDIGEALREILREAGISRAAITAGRGDVRIVVSRAAVERAVRGR